MSEVSNSDQQSLARAIMMRADERSLFLLRPLSRQQSAKDFSERGPAFRFVQERRHDMRCFWEHTVLLGPIYNLLGQGLNPSEIASKLDLPN
jgi:hypothetical protein